MEAKYRIKINDRSNIIYLRGKEIRTPCEAIVSEQELQVLLSSLLAYGTKNYTIKKIQQEVVESVEDFYFIDNKKESKLPHSERKSKIYDEMIGIDKKVRTMVLTTSRPKEKRQTFVITEKKERKEEKGPVVTKAREVSIPPSLKRGLIAPHSAFSEAPLLEQGNTGRIISKSRELSKSIQRDDLEREKLLLTNIDKFSPSVLLKDDTEVKIEELTIESGSILKRVLKEIT